MRLRRESERNRGRQRERGDEFSCGKTSEQRRLTISQTYKKISNKEKTKVIVENTNL